MAHPARTPIPDDQHFDLLRDFRRQSLDLYTDLLVLNRERFLPTAARC